MEPIIVPQLDGSTVAQVCRPATFPLYVPWEQGCVVALRAGTGHISLNGRLELARSTDRGATWQQDRVPLADSEPDDHNPALKTEDMRRKEADLREGQRMRQIIGEPDRLYAPSLAGLRSSPMALCSRSAGAGGVDGAAGRRARCGASEGGECVAAGVAAGRALRDPAAAVRPVEQRPEGRAGWLPTRNARMRGRSWGSKPRKPGSRLRTMRRD